MLQITLKPLDDGQKAVEIPLGKTTIGRGSFLGCSDKKVSRNHAVLEVTNKGEVFLTPTHVNPCFYQPTADSPGQILKKDVPHKLENGDSFSLLPRAYRYQLIVESETSQNETTDQNDSNKQLGKTNGSVGDLLNDGAATNEELGDTIVPEKTFNKEENLNVEKSNSKEENTFSKKIAEIKDNSTHDFPKDGEENSASDPLEKSSAPPNENNLLIKEPSPLPTENKEDEKKESCTKGEVQTVRTESEANDSSDEGYVDAEEKPASSVTKVVEEDNSIPELNSEPKANVQEGEQKSESKISAITSEEKTSDKESHSKEEADIGDSNDLSSNEVVQNVQTSDEIPAASTKATRKKATKKPQKERLPIKRKTVLENPPKPKGRKKNKINFDDAEAGTSRQPGRTSSRTNRQTRQGLSLEDFVVSDDDEWQSDRSEPKTRRKRGRRRAGEDSGSDWEVDHKKTKKPLHKMWSGSESGSEQNSQKKKKGPKGRRKKVQSDEGVTNDVVSDEEPQPSSSGEVKLDKLRIPCTYGKKCYRRSTNHTDQFSHPGDSDYTSETETNQKTNAAISESEEESPKRECPYGVNCFRKNPQHKKDFKHTKKVRPQREAAKQADKKAKNSTRNSDEVDSYDLNDSFLNDDSADEYKPIDSGSDYENGEKTKKLAKVKGSKRGRGKKL